MTDVNPISPAFVDEINANFTALDQAVSNLMNVNAVVTFSSVAELELYDGPATTAIVIAASTFGDGGTDVYAVKPNDLSPSDGSIVVVDETGRRWWRLYRSVVSDTFPSSFGSTPTTIRAIDQGSYPTAGMIPAGVLQQHAAAMVVPATYTQSPWPNVNYSAYLDNQAALSGQSGGNYFSIALSRHANSYAANHNGVLSNAAPLHALSGSGQGNHFGALIGYEINPNIWKVQTAAPWLWQ